MTSPPCLSLCQHHPSCCATRTKSVAVKLSQRVTNFRRSLQASKMQKWVFSECSHQVATMCKYMEDWHWIEKGNEGCFRNGGVWVGVQQRIKLPSISYFTKPKMFAYKRVWLWSRRLINIPIWKSMTMYWIYFVRMSLWDSWALEDLGERGTRGKDRTPPHFSNHCSSTS